MSKEAEEFMQKKWDEMVSLMTLKTLSHIHPHRTVYEQLDTNLDLLKAQCKFLIDKQIREQFRGGEN